MLISAGQLRGNMLKSRVTLQLSADNIYIYMYNNLNNMSSRIKPLLKLLSCDQQRENHLFASESIVRYSASFKRFDDIRRLSISKTASHENGKTNSLRIGSKMSKAIKDRHGSFKKPVPILLGMT